MTNRLITLSVNLTLIGPVLTQSSAASGYGVDALMAKNSDGKFYLPGTLIKGRLRQAWKELTACLPAAAFNPDIHALLGEESGKLSAGVSPDRGRLLFSDFVAQSGTDGKALFRIKIDKERGAVETGAYLVMEAPFTAGKEAVFIGTISFYADTDKDEIKEWIEAGLRWNMSFGAERTVGFGRLKSVSIHEPSPSPVQTGQTTTGDSFVIAITPDAPFCIANRQLKENLFESGEIIPGGVIKGAVASTWGMMLGKGANEIIAAGFDGSRKELSESFDKIRFTHAFPSDKGTCKRPTTFPLSLVKSVNGTLKDVAMIKDAEPVDAAAPSFSIDWKESGDVTGKFGWPEVNKELRVRTALDSTKRKSKDEKLFAYEMIVPTGLVWLAEVDLSRVKSGDDKKENDELRNTVKSQLIELLLHGLQGFSKTKTTAGIAVLAVTAKQQVKPIEGNSYIITLQTAAILLGKPGDLDEKSGKAELENVYKAVWAKLSNGTLEMDNYFARQSLAGGDYLHKRFQKGKDYYPWLLTDAGSVFVLKTTGKGDGAAKISEWLKQGLPLPKWAEDHYARNGKAGDDWSNCPYIPENGYGEIRLTENLIDIPAPAKEEK